MVGLFHKLFSVLDNRNGSDPLSQTHFYFMAGGKGVEPLFTESESVVLPLNDPPILKTA